MSLAKSLVWGTVLVSSSRCPVCNGTGRVPVDSTGRPLHQTTPYPRWPQYAVIGEMECRNCGGQTMGGVGSGLARNRPDGEPCVHQYTATNAGRCYTRHECKLCGDTYHIDSSD